MNKRCRGLYGCVIRESCKLYSPGEDPMSEDEFIIEEYKAAAGCPNYEQRKTMPVIFEEIDDSRFYAPI